MSQNHRRAAAATTPTKKSSLFEVPLCMPWHIASIQWQSSLALLNIPQPWFGGVGLPPPAFRWGVNMDGALDLEFAGNLEGLLLGLAGSPPNSMLILPGHSTAIPNAPQHWGLIEIGRTVDDATIVFYP
jgi:hypothetical protein